jgi:predicted GIY-YIG superfamily endonuclease
VEISQAMTMIAAQRERGMAKKSGDKWFVYILRCGDGSLYTGITKDVRRRCEQHNAGTASRYTRSRLPVAVVYQESKPSRSLALKREAAIKTMSRLEKESLILTGNEGWPQMRKNENLLPNFGGGARRLC